jgi:hypothetical protein
MPANANGLVRNDSVNLRVASLAEAMAVFAYADQQGYVRLI